MVFAGQKLRRHPALTNPTVLIVVDRRDLKTQLSDDFDACDYPNVEKALGVEDLKAKLVALAREARAGGGALLGAHPDWSLTRQMAQAYSTTEGWAHYAEQMMVEQGLGDGDPKLKIGQIEKALLRDCRFIASTPLCGSRVRRRHDRGGHADTLPNMAS
jgi:hypothetical protein